MLVTTTPTIEGGRITRYYGIVSGETIIGANVFRDFFASIRDVVGGRSGSVGGSGSMLMVTACGTAVTVE